MSNDTSHLSDELDGHKTRLTNWATEARKLDVSPSCKKVQERFVRDCETLVSDIDNSDDPSAADLCDFDDRTNSLEIQYHSLTDPNSD